MSEADGAATSDLNVTVSGWDRFMLDRVAEHQDIPVAQIASAALNTGLHQYAETFNIPRPRIRRDVGGDGNG